MIWDFRPGAWLPLKSIYLNEVLELCINTAQSALHFNWLPNYEPRVKGTANKSESIHILMYV